MDVNEELVRRYFELKGYFVRTNVRYAYRADKGTGWSDIDLCVLHPRTGDAAAVEVKGWHTGPVTPSYLKQWPSMFYFTRPEASRAVEALLGKSTYRRVLVLSKVADRGRKEIVAYAGDRGVEILEFPEILRFLISETPTGQSAGSETEHVLRLLKVYGLVKG